MNAQTFASTSGKNCKRPINRINHSVPDCLDTHIISDDSETEQNISNFNTVHHTINMKPNSLNDILQLTKSIRFQNKTGENEDYNFNKKLKTYKDIQPSQNFLEIIEVDSRSSDTNEPEILIVPPPVPLDSILFKTSSEKTSDFATSTPSSIKKLKAGPLPSPPPSPPLRPMLKNTPGNFERYLANLEKRFTKLSSEDKVLNWNFSNDVDDVEDFVEFDKHGQMLKMKFRSNSKNNNNNNNEMLKIHQNSSQLEKLTIKGNVTKNEIMNMLKPQKKSSIKYPKKPRHRKCGNQKKLKLIANGRLNSEEITSTNSETFKIPNVPRKYLICKPCQNSDEGCGNSDCELLTEEHKEEFCKYLGLSTKSQNGEMLSSASEHPDLKRRSLRVRQIQCQAKAMQKSNILKREIQSQTDGVDFTAFAVKPEKIRNPNIFPKYNEINEKKNGEIRIVRSTKMDPTTKENSQQPPQVVLHQNPSTVLPEVAKEKSRIKIVCSLNSNVIASNPVSNQSSSVPQTTLPNEVRNSLSPLSINSKNSQKLSLGRSSCHADDENSSQNNVNINRKKDSLIIVKNTYEQKPSPEINPSIIPVTASNKEHKISIQNENITKSDSNENDRDKGKIKILERVTYSPKTVKRDTPLIAYDRIKTSDNVHNHMQTSVDYSKDVKDKIKIEFAANYDSKNLKTDSNIDDNKSNIVLANHDIKSEKSFKIDDENVNKMKNENINAKPMKKQSRITLKNINKKLVISPIPKSNTKNRPVGRPSKKFKTLVKNPSSLKFFRLVLKNPKQKQKLTKKITETKILNKRNRRQKSISDKSLNLLNNAKTVQKPEENLSKTNLLQQQLPKSIVTISSNEVVSENLKLNLIPNPLKFEDGDVLHAYYEKDSLIVVQQNTISFWKYSKILQMLGQDQEWELLGESKRNLNDEEIISPLKNRLLLHENIPIYTEIRARQLPYSNRECSLLSPYICIYYFDAIKNIVQQHAIQLDSIKSLVPNVIYTTITNSRYFIICWKQDTPNSTNRTGLCKYALTPDLDTLASIREFKHLRHVICSLECINEERLIGFGETQVTVWDYHTGDILSNLDLGMNIGRNLGAIMYSIQSDDYMLLYQLIHVEDDNPDNIEETFPQLKIFALNISHNSPSYRLIYGHKLPIQFDNIKSALNLNNYIIVTSLTGEELWMLVQQPQRLLFMNDEISTSLKRFYTTGSENYVEITGDYLNVKTIHENLMNVNN
ncbi:uncharacterized protein LOC129616588 [Condylostylus longicornis]|uniref:uncharacterized protein LOC129616588 n=1 Tax=Condylostylus longicornis TaxID=2530218 RepID=UPI00244E4264|nr:uncharacterized protein LOC129616588 [Condylostylus longicornis]